MSSLRMGSIVWRNEVTGTLSGEDAATTAKLLRIIDDLPMYQKFKIELAVTIDTMLPFVKATYFLKGDGPLAQPAFSR